MQPKTAQYFVDVNRAGFHMLRLYSDSTRRESSVVIPLGLDQDAANANAMRYINNLNNPLATLETLGADLNIPALLNVVVPIRPHKGKTIGEVLEINPGYLLWMLNTVDPEDKRVGECMSALRTLYERDESRFAEKSKDGSGDRKITTLRHIGQVGSELSLKFTARYAFPLPGKDGAIKVVGIDENDQHVYFISKSKLAIALAALVEKRVEQAIPLICKVKEHSDYKGAPQTQITELKLAGPAPCFGVVVAIRHQAQTPYSDVESALVDYMPLAHPLLAAGQFTGYSVLKGSNVQSGEVQAKAYYTIATFMPLELEALKEIAASFQIKNHKLFSCYELRLATVINT